MRDLLRRLLHRSDERSQNRYPEAILPVTVASRWQPTAIATGLWCLLALGLLLSVSAFLATRPGPSAAVEASAPGASPAIAGVAEWAAVTWLTAQPASVMDGLVVDMGSYVNRDPNALEVTDTHVVSVDVVEDGLWAVTVATTVLVENTDEDPATVTLFLQLGVAETESGPIVLAPPAPVPPPPNSPGAVDLVTSRLSGVDLSDARVTAAVEFVTALLSGDPAVGRYGAPGVEVTPAVPAGVFVSVKPIRASVTETDAGDVIRLEVEAETASGQTTLFAYVVTVNERDGRSEITAFGGVPPITRTNSSPTPGSADTTTDPMSSSPSSSSPLTSQAPSVTVPVSAAEPEGSGLDGPYTTVDRPGA